MLVVIAACGLHADALAVMIRHDIPDSAYVELALLPDFAASRVTLLTDSQSTSGTLISPRHVITAGHLVAGWVPENTHNAPCALEIRIGTNLCTGTHVFLFPAYDRSLLCGGFDVAVIRLAEPVSDPPPAAIWTGGVYPGQRFIGVGQGRTGTGHDNDEPFWDGLYRGFENTADYFFPPEEHSHWRSDFDNGDPAYNTLAGVLFGPTNLPLEGGSSPVPLPLEGSVAAGDSGSGVYLQKQTGWLLAGITSYRWYSQYGGQAGFVNLSNPDIASWLADIASVENTGFPCVNQVPSFLKVEADSSRVILFGNPDRPYELQGTDSLQAPGVWTSQGTYAVTSLPFIISFPAETPPPRFLRAVERPDRVRQGQGPP